jgi:nucleotide-binding universal stress UspA family protein
MYRLILLALDHTPTDEALLAYIPELARLHGSKLLLLHVADGWVARNFDQLNLSPSEEMHGDWEYLQTCAARLREQTGLEVEPRLAFVNVAVEEGCDLSAMVSHGHKLIGGILHGSTIDAVRHNATVPVLAIPANCPPSTASK